MSISVVTVTSGNAVGATTNNTASIARTIGRIYAICVGATHSASVTPPTPTVTGTGITQLASVTLVITGTGTTRRTMTIVLVLATSTGSAVMTINHSSAPTRVAWLVDEATEVDTTIPRVATNDQSLGGSATAALLNEVLTMNDHGVGHTGDRYYSFVWTNVNTAVVRAELDADKAGTTNSVDWQDLGSTSYASAPVQKLNTFWNNESVRKDLTPGWVTDTTATYGQIAIELSQAIAAVVERAARFNRRPRGNFINATRY